MCDKDNKEKTRTQICIDGVRSEIHPEHVSTRQELIKRLKERIKFIESEIETDNLLGDDPPWLL